MAYHLRSPSGWSLTGSPPRARTEVTPTASLLHHVVLDFAANQGHFNPETTSIDLLVGEVYPMSKFMEELAATKWRPLRSFLRLVTRPVKENSLPNKPISYITRCKRVSYPALPIGLLTRSKQPASFSWTDQKMRWFKKTFVYYSWVVGAVASCLFLWSLIWAVPYALLLLSICPVVTSLAWVFLSFVSFLYIHCLTDRYI